MLMQGHIFRIEQLSSVFVHLRGEEPAFRRPRKEAAAVFKGDHR